MKRTGWQKTWVRILTTALTIAMMAVIFGFSMENADRSNQTSEIFAGRLISLFYPEYGTADPVRQQEIYDTMQHTVRKCAHFTEYLLLGFLMRLCAESWAGHRIRKGAYLLLFSFLAGLAYACTDEMHQLAVAGRSGQWTDVLVDCLGVLAGALLGTLAVRLISGRAGQR